MVLLQGIRDVIGVVPTEYPRIENSAASHPPTNLCLMILKDIERRNSQLLVKNLSLLMKAGFWLAKQFICLST